MGLVFSVLAAIAVILGLVTLFKPIPKLRLTTRGRSLMLVGIGLAVLMVAGKPPQKDGAQPGGPGQQMANIGGQGGPGGGPGGQNNPAKQQQRPQKPTRQEMPMLPSQFSAKQLRFLAHLEDARVAVMSAANPTAQSAIQVQRRDAVCELMPEVAVTNWIGKVKAMSADVQGRGMVAVEIGNKVLLTTPVNPQSEAEADGMVPRKSQLYTDVSRFKTGDPVVISGEFLPGEGSCVKDIGTLTDPVFLFKFTGMVRFF